MKHFGLILLCVFCFSLVGTPVFNGVHLSAGVQPVLAEDDDFDDDPFADDAEAVEIADPIKSVNEAFFWINDTLYFWVLKPVARGWRIVPEPARVSVDNFFENWMFPKRFVNTTLQGKLTGTATETGRFLVNTTVGLLGFFDPAKSWLGWDAYNEDTGQTLGAWGLGHGFYLVLPVFGPSSLRDGVGRVGDSFLDPMNYVGMKTTEQVGLRVFDTVNYLSIDKDTYESIKKNALDPYLFVRDAYIQRRAKQVAE